MLTELLREKVAQLESQLNSYKLEQFILDLSIQDVFPDEPNAADEVATAVHKLFVQESRNAQARIQYLQRKINVRQPIYDDLKAEQTLLDGAKPK